MINRTAGYTLVGPFLATSNSTELKTAKLSAIFLTPFKVTAVKFIK